MLFSPVYSDSWPRQEGLKVCHININHIINKIDEISHILFSNNLDIFGVSESRLNVNNNDDEIQIPGYFAERRDSSFINHTGLCIYIKCDIRYTRRKDLESDEVESLWIELQLPGRSVFIGFIYRNPRDMIVWEDQFCDMLDNIVSLNKEYLLLGDFNIDLMFPRHRWTSIISSFNLQQLIKYPTRVTVNSCTLLDHIYVDINCSFKEICVVQCGLSDHFPICITLGFDKVKSSPKTHHEIRFRNFNNFDFNAFIADNDFKLFENMLGISDPDSALQLWVHIFTSIFNKHAPYCTKRVKTRQHNHWFTSEIKLELRHRDWLLKHGSRVEYKKQRNNVKNLIRKAKKTYFETIIKNKVSQKSIWTAINEITGKKKHVRTNPSISLTANDFSSAFACTNSFSNIISDDDLFSASHLTQAFCQEKLLGGHVKFDVPLMTMDDLITYFRILKPKKSCSFDEISMFMLKLAMPRILSSLVYI